MSIKSEIERLQVAKGDIRDALALANVDVPDDTRIDGYAGFLPYAYTMDYGMLTTPDVVFRGINGRTLFSYTKEEFLALEEMPVPPEAPGLVFQGWNRSLESMRSMVSKVGCADTGAMYTTTDGKTRLWVRVYDETPVISFDKAGTGTVAIDWGDGSDPVSTAAQRSRHTYAKGGIYVITVEKVSGDLILGTGTSYGMVTTTVPGIRDTSLASPLVRLDVGGADGLAYRGCYFGDNLHTVVMSAGMTGIDSGETFYQSHDIKSLCIPDGITGIPRATFTYCANLSQVTIPDSVTTIGNGAFRFCFGLYQIILPGGITSIGSLAFQNTARLMKVVVAAETPPTLGTDVFSNSNALKRQIIVPKGCADAYKEATGWSAYASYIVEAEE